MSRSEIELADRAGVIDGKEEIRSELDAVRRIAKDQEVVIDKLIRGVCIEQVSLSICCGEGVGAEKQYCSYVCQLRAERRIT